jgi:hypothetical protein
MQANQRYRGGKFCRWRHQLPGLPDRSICKKPMFYWLFDYGTAFAHA